MNMYSYTDHLTSYEVSKALYDLGLKQSTDYYWIISASTEPTLVYREWAKRNRNLLKHTPIEYPSYIATELIEKLPESLVGDSYNQTTNYYLMISKHNSGWHIAYVDLKGTIACLDIFKQINYEVTAKSLQDVAGRMIEFLVSNHLMEVAKV